MKFIVGNDFFDSLNALHRKGQNFSRPFEKALSIFNKSRNASDIDTVFSGVKKTNNGEKRIKHAIKYDLGRACRLVTYQSKKICMFLFAGDHDTTDSWIENNRGLELGLDKVGNSYKIFYASSNKSSDERPFSGYTPESFSLADQLPELFKDSVFKQISWKNIEDILKLTSMSSDDEIENALDGVSEVTLYDVLVDVLVLSRQRKNVALIEQRIQAYFGEIIPIEEAEEEQLDSANISLDATEIDLNNNQVSKFIENALKSDDYKRWMLFMHPDQKFLSEKKFAGPTLLKGVSGSGKTAVVVNRALHLSSKYPHENVAVFTLNKSLATLIKKLVISADGKDSNIEVFSFWNVCKDLLRDFEPDRKKHFDERTWKAKEDISDTWMEFYHQETEDWSDVMFPVHQSLLSQGIYPEEYIKEEFDFIRSALSGESREEYLKMKREGRSIPLSVEYRKMILKGLTAWEEKMDFIGNIDYVGITSRVFRHIEKITPKFRCILIDEMQDFGTLELAILRKLVKKDENDLFFAGDLVQRVHTKQHSFNAAGIKIPNDQRYIINQNYRNSREILEAANFILEDNLTGTSFEDASIEVIEPKYAQSSDYLPYVLEAETLNEELTSAVQYLQERVREDGPGHNGCIAICGYTLPELEPLSRKLKVQLLDDNIDLAGKSIFISDLEQTKGFEFDHMIIVSCNRESLPNPNLPEEEAYRDLSRFYIAMTRARKNLIISYNGQRSTFLDNIDDYFFLDKWSSQILLSNMLDIKAPKPIRGSERFSDSSQVTEVKLSYGELTGKELLLTRRAIGMNRNRQDRLLNYITGKNIKSDTVRNREWKSLNELYKEDQVTINTIIAGNSKVSDERHYFEKLFSVGEFSSKKTNSVKMSLSYQTLKNNDTDDQLADWQVDIKPEYTLGVCMHCGKTAIPGDYVCYNCNPG